MAYDCGHDHDREVVVGTITVIVSLDTDGSPVVRVEKEGSLTTIESVGALEISKSVMVERGSSSY